MVSNRDNRVNSSSALQADALERGLIVPYDSQLSPKSGQKNNNNDDGNDGGRRKSTDSTNARDLPSTGEFFEMLGTEKPRDLLQGIWKFVFSIVKGICFAVSLLFIMPYSHASDRRNNAREDAKLTGEKAKLFWPTFLGITLGFLMGLIAFPFVILIFVFLAIIQLVRGLFYTPSAIYYACKGKKWNSKTREWEDDFYSLQAEKEQFLAKEAGDDGKNDASAPAEAPTAATIGPVKKVADTYYYDLLEVPTNATSNAIKKAYYRGSLKYHPDKNEGDPEADQKFRDISEAYQVLSDEQRRKTYDKQGRSAATVELTNVDPHVFFMVLFGAGKFEPFFGRLRMATKIEGLFDGQDSAEDLEEIMADKEKSKIMTNAMDEAQQAREVKCAIYLAEILDPLARGDVDEATFRKTWELKAQELAKRGKDKETLREIGTMYDLRARQHLSLCCKQIYKMREGTHTGGTKLKAGKTGAKAFFAVRNVMKELEAEEQRRTAIENQNVGQAMMVSMMSPTSAFHSAIDAESGVTNPEDSQEEEPIIPTVTQEEEPIDPTEKLSRPDGASRDFSSNSRADTARPSTFDEIPAQPATAASSTEQPPNATSAATPSPPPPGPTSTSATPSPPPPPQATPPPDDDSYQHLIGCRVLVKGLKKQPQLNDSLGRVIDYDVATGRYHVGLHKTQAESRGSPPVLSVTPDKLINLSQVNPDADMTEDDVHPMYRVHGPNNDPIYNAEYAQKAQEAMLKALPTMVDALWEITRMDVQNTLGNVAQKVLSDKTCIVNSSSNSEVKAFLKKRAKALQILGHCFLNVEVQTVTRSKEEEKAAKCRKLEEAVMLMTSGADPEDVDDFLAKENSKDSVYEFSSPPQTPPSTSRQSNQA